MVGEALGEVCGFAGVGDEQYRYAVSRWTGGSVSVWVMIGHRPVLPGRIGSKRENVRPVRGRERGPRFVSYSLMMEGSAARRRPGPAPAQRCLVASDRDGGPCGVRGQTGNPEQVRAVEFDRENV